jgi:4-hydroxythreonine-4-phosphate dehydrogenase
MLVITPGDPAGIGPEVTVKALAKRLVKSTPVHAVLIGDAAVLRIEAARVGLPLYETSTVDRSRPGVGLWEPSGDEPVEVRAIRAAVAACQSGRADALVTGPIHKERLAARGFAYPGHTDFLGHLCGVDNPVMAFVGGRLRVALVTVHLPLRSVADAISQAGVEHVLRTVSQASGLHCGVRA